MHISLYVDYCKYACIIRASSFCTETAVSLRSKVWLTVGLLGASMAAHAEYKEVWNPPEATRGATHAHAHAHPAKVAPAKHVASVKAKPTAKKPHGVAVKATHATHTPHTASAKVAHAKPVEAAAKPQRVAASPAVQPGTSGNHATPRELPPILH